ncbi:MAG: hypothetical protein IT290_06870 [Deltaproteobacteria bacterium]|nr:hypothetical protein [Deltaproteobacteria bacterium]
MGDSFAKLDQALKDLIEAYVALDEEMSGKYSDDNEAYNNAMTEVLETSIESALEEQDAETKYFANMITVLSDALESIDPVAFEDALTETDDDEEYSGDDDDDEEYDDLDEDGDDEDE